MYLIATIIGILAAAAAYVGYRRRRSRMTPAGLTEEAIRRIETEGRIDVDEPLDWEEIQEAEEQFWDETWDEPEEFG